MAGYADLVGPIDMPRSISALMRICPLQSIETAAIVPAYWLLSVADGGRMAQT